MHLHALVVGFGQMADTSTVVNDVLSEPELAGFRVDFRAGAQNSARAGAARVALGKKQLPFVARLPEFRGGGLFAVPGRIGFAVSAPDDLKIAPRDAGGGRRAHDVAIVAGEHSIHVAALELRDDFVSRARKR
jgi:hypothetical protein